jgi:uncharacterized RDD family membrane protein YckC
VRVTEADLRANYESFETERLLELRGRGNLTEAAQRALENILDERSIPSDERAKAASAVKEQVAKEEQAIASLASLGERVGAQLIDFFVASATMVIFFLVSMAIPNAFVIGAILFFGYLLLSDGQPRGQSVGKRVLGIAVIHRRTRKSCTYAQSFVRNFLSLLLGVIDWLFIFGRTQQRLGDMIANTIVVRIRLRERVLHEF